MSATLPRCTFPEQESSQPQSSSGQGGAGSFQNTAISSGGIGYSGSSGGGGVSGGHFNAPIIGFAAGVGGGMNSTNCGAIVGGDPAQLLAVAQRGKQC